MIFPSTLAAAHTAFECECECECECRVVKCREAQETAKRKRKQAAAVASSLSLSYSLTRSLLWCLSTCPLVFLSCSRFLSRMRRQSPSDGR